MSIAELDSVISATSVTMNRVYLFVFTKRKTYTQRFIIEETTSGVTLVSNEHSKKSPYGTDRFLASFSVDLTKPCKNGGCDATLWNVYNYTFRGEFQLPIFMSFFCVSPDGSIYYFHRLTIDNYKKVRL